MLRFITGKTGGGKTQFAVGKVIDALRETKMPIVTNMALRLDPWVNGRGDPYKGLIRTLQDKFGDDFDARRRIHFLTDDRQIERFFAVRPLVPEDKDEPVKVLEVPRSEDGRWHFDGTKYPPCVFIIDEGHEYWPQKEWQRLGKETESWASQNRRSGDECYIITQEAELVAKPFRRQSLECYWMVNHGYRALMMFRQPELIKYSLYLSTPPTPSEPHLRMGTLGYPRGFLQGCYDTASGAGVAGGAADIGRKIKGLPWWSSILIVIGLLIASGFALSGCVNIVAATIRNKAPKVPEQIVAPMAKLMPQVTNSAPAPVVAPSPVFIPELPRVEAQTNVVTGYAISGKGGAVVFDDGSRLMADRVKVMGREIAVDGIIYPLRIRSAKKE